MLPPSMHMPVVMRLERGDSCVTYTSIFSNCVGMFICSFLRNAHLLFCMNLIFWKALKVLGSIPAKTRDVGRFPGTPEAFSGMPRNLLLRVLSGVQPPLVSASFSPTVANNLNIQSSVD